MSKQKPKNRKKKIWRKELPVSWSRKAHGHTKVEGEVVKGYSPLADIEPQEE